jgi:hypothetical protein
MDPKKTVPAVLAVLLLGLPITGREHGRAAAAMGEEPGQTMHDVVFSTYVEWAGQLAGACRLTESLRAFGGAWRDAPVWVYMPDDASVDDSESLARLRGLGVEVRTSHTPEVAKWFFYGGKPFGAAAAEEAAAGWAALLVWLDQDTIILDEPREFHLAPGVGLAYCPVMHNRSGTLYGSALNAFWSRIYEKLGLSDDLLFPMITPADQQKIRAYFHCGQLAVRPEKGILRQWARQFETLCGDSVLVAMCKEDRDQRVFLHQTALTGAVLHTLQPKEMVALSGRYNYPIFFERQYGASRPFDSITDVATIRCVVSAEKMGPDWATQLTGPADRIAWLKEHLR